MRIPASIDIFGQTYSIEYMDSETLHGKCCHETKKIFLDRSLTGDDKIQTLCHECLHALLYRIGASAELSDDFEEILVDTMATWFVETFKLKLRGTCKRATKTASGRP